MKLEVGMYVRTKDGCIAKIEEVDDILIEFDNWLWQDYDLQIDFVNADDEEKIKTITKVSHNIIDLIEVGDYVNGIKVDDKAETLLWFYDNDGDWYLENNDIKSIVTKEQFESISYKVDK